MLPAVQAGRRDLERAADALASRLPEALGVFARIAYNYRWSWSVDGPSVFRAIDPERWDRCAENPVRLLQEADAGLLAAAAEDDELLARAAALDEEIRGDLARPAREGTASPDRPIAYFSAEYGVHVSLPIYSGGLGALAGDILKEASDMAQPLVAVGLMYRNGYFRQRIDANGWQHEYWVDTDPDRLPAALVRSDDGTPLTVTVPVGDQEVTAQIWRVDVGRVPLFLLDADRPENDEIGRWITSRLYIGDTDVRLAQYVLLGVGGVQALAAMDIEPGIVHLNEGHAAFVTLEMARRETSGNGSLQAALEIARAAHGVHHAHAGPGRQRHLPRRAGRGDARAGGRRARASTPRRSSGSGARRRRSRPSRSASRSSRCARAARPTACPAATARWRARCGTACGRDRGVDDVPITYVTNGAHLPTWLGKPMRALLDRHLGEDWLTRASDPATWEPVEDIPAAELWARAARAALGDGRLRARARRARPARPRRAARLRRGRRELRPGRADARLRPPPGHLQAAEPAAAGLRAGR